MFIDKARIYVRAGKGGDGCLSFRREKFVPQGGPNGGSGGKGGNAILRASSSLKTLYDFQRHPHYSAGDGTHGQGGNKSGKEGEDLVIFVPCGTVVWKDGNFLADLISPGEEIIVAQGGRGGKGNAAFKSSRNPAPRIAEKGEPGEEAVVDLELKLIADVGIVGYPNAGKSTFLSKITSARPKIASYPFTTISPNLGVAKFGQGDIIFADIPGLIEGAHLGKGLGVEFLRHIERTKILLHLVDIFGYEGKSAKESFFSLNQELKLYSAKLFEKPMLIALNKIDLPGAEEKVKEFKRLLSPKLKKKYPIFPISALTSEGAKEACNYVVKMLDSLPRTFVQDADEISKTYFAGPEPSRTKVRGLPEEKTAHYIFLPDFSIEKKGNIFYISGKKVERFVAMTNFSQPEAVKRLHNIFKKIGLEKALIAQGITDGDTIKVGKYEFTYRSESRDQFINRWKR